MFSSRTKILPTVSAGLLCALVVACGDDGDSAYPGRGFDGGDSPLRPGGSGGRSGGGSAGISDAGGAVDGGVARDGSIAGTGDAQSGSGGSSGAGGRSGSSGTSGAGGGGPGGTGGTGSGTSGTGPADDGVDDPATCVPCEQQVPSDSLYFGAREKCLDAEGSAARGPKAGALLADLCVDVLNCIWNSGCNSNGNISDCFCGEGVDTIECFLGNFEDVNGPCKDEIAAAAESTETGNINNRFSDPMYAVGLAYRLVGSDSNYCPFECGFCTPAPGSGPEGDELCHPNEWDTDADAGVGP